MSILSSFLEFLGFGSDDVKKQTHTESASDVVVPRNDAERELLERVRTLGLHGRLDIQYAYAGLLDEAGKFLAVLPWPGDDDTIKHGACISLTPPKEGGTVSLMVSGIRTATIAVAEKYGYEPLLTGPLMYAGGVLVMLFGFKQKVV